MLKVKPESIPDTLKDIPQWVVWRKQKKAKSADKYHKIPLEPINLKASGPENPDNWLDFDSAVRLLEGKEGQVDGLAIYLTADLGIAIIDVSQSRSYFYRRHQLRK